MNALYLTYVILAIVYLLGKKDWDTYWLRQGNYLFFAFVSLITLLDNSIDIGMAYFTGYLEEMVLYYKETTGGSYSHLWASVIFIPLIGIGNFSYGIRNNQKIQIALWILASLSLAHTALQQENLDILLPFELFSIQKPTVPGWYTYVGASYIPPILIPLLLLLGLGISTLFGKYLKRKSERRTSQH